MNTASCSQLKHLQLLVIVLLIRAAGSTTRIRAREVEAKNIYAGGLKPESIRVSTRMGMMVQPAGAIRPGRTTLGNMAIVALTVGEAMDSWGTYRNLKHTKWICGNSPAFADSYDMNVPGEISGPGDVQAVCGKSPLGGSANWAFDVSRLGYFSEGGWVTQFHLAGGRDFAAVEGWNLANDVGWYLVARHLGRKSGWIGRCGPLLNFGRGLVHLQMGIGNFIAVTRNQNPNTLNLYVPKDSNYSAPRWWGKR
jgi:hypothetical protein